MALKAAKGCPRETKAIVYALTALLEELKDIKAALEKLLERELNQDKEDGELYE